MATFIEQTAGEGSIEDKERKRIKPWDGAGMGQPEEEARSMSDRKELSLLAFRLGDKEIVGGLLFVFSRALSEHRGDMDFSDIKSGRIWKIF